MWKLVSKLCLKVLHEKIGQNAGQRGAHCNTFYLLVETIIKREHSRVTTKFNKFNKGINSETLGKWQVIISEFST